MNRGPCIALVSSLFSALLAVCAPPASADWLVLRNQTTIETRGPWKVKGRQVVFTDRQGRLVSFQLEDVDLDASQSVTAAAKAPPPPRPAPPPAPPSPPPRPIAIITDADVRPAAPASSTLNEGIILYTTDWCGVCKRTKRYLDLLEVPYQEKDVERDPIARMEYHRKSGSDQVLVPLVEIDGQYDSGFDRFWIDERLQERIIRRAEREQARRRAEAGSPP